MYKADLLNLSVYSNQTSNYVTLMTHGTVIPAQYDKKDLIFLNITLLSLTARGSKERERFALRNLNDALSLAIILCSWHATVTAF